MAKWNFDSDVDCKDFWSALGRTRSIGAVGALWRNRARLPKNIFLLAKNVHQQLQVSGAALKFEASDDCVPVKFCLFSVLTDYKY